MTLFKPSPPFSKFNVGHSAVHNSVFCGDDFGSDASRGQPSNGKDFYLCKFMQSVPFSTVMRAVNALIMLICRMTVPSQIRPCIIEFCSVIVGNLCILIGRWAIECFADQHMNPRSAPFRQGYAVISRLFEHKRERRSLVVAMDIAVSPKNDLDSVQRPSIPKVGNLIARLVSNRPPFFHRGNGNAVCIWCPQ